MTASHTLPAADRRRAATILLASPVRAPLLCLGGRDVVVEAEEVVRIVAPLHLPQPLEVRVAVGRAHAFDGLIRSSVVEVAAAAGRALLERGGRAPRPGDVVGVTGGVLPDRECVTLELFSLRLNAVASGDTRSAAPCICSISTSSPPSCGWPDPGWLIQGV